MNNLKITEGMVLALLGKGINYEIEDCEMEYQVDIPLGGFGLTENPESGVVVDVKMTIGKMKFEIQKG